MYDRLLMVVLLCLIGVNSYWTIFQCDESFITKFSWFVVSNMLIMGIGSCLMDEKEKSKRRDRDEDRDR